MKKRRGIEGDPTPARDSESKKPKTTEIGEWARKLLEKGTIPATEFVEGARAEVASSSSGGASSLAQHLARGKRDSKHAARDVHRALNKHVTLPEPYKFKTTFGDQKRASSYEL